MKKRLTYLGCFFASILGYFLLQKPIFMLYNGACEKGTAFTDYLRVLFHGFTLDACREMLAAGEWRELKNVKICGLMMMASNVDDEEQIKREFNEASLFFDEVKQKYFADDDSFCERSWGMSGDYGIAVKCRSTMVRIGTAIFGEREY